MVGVFYVMEHTEKESVQDIVKFVMKTQVVLFVGLVQQNFIMLVNLIVENVHLIDYINVKLVDLKMITELQIVLIMYSFK
jgi:hypothetical protein